MTEFEFFMELRLNGVEQLGQVRLAILETNGQISVYFFADEKVKPGLAFCLNIVRSVSGSCRKRRLRLRALQ